MSSHSSRRCALAAAGALLANSACSTSAQEPNANDRPLVPVVSETRPLASAADPSVGARGFQHHVGASRFALGSFVESRTEQHMAKHVGQQGVFATREKTGLVIAASNADSPARLLGPLSTVAAVHNDAVRAYFVSAGLPEDQIGRVSEQPIMRATGEEKEADGRPVVGTLEAYFSTVERQVNGVVVADSYAWARMNASGAVVMESVYWPDLPRDVVAEANALARTMSDPSTRGAFIARLPRNEVGENERGRVVVRHTPGVWDSGLVARASYDVPTKNRSTHFDVRGLAFELPHERADAWGAPPSSVKR